MNEKIALKNVFKLGMGLMIIGFAVAFWGLFASIEGLNILNFSLMLVGVVITSLGYALASLYFYRSEDAKDNKNQQFCIGC